FWSNQKHWEWATINPNPREKASFLKENISPIQKSGQLNFITEDQNYDSNITVRYAYGHTEAMMLPQIEYKGKTNLYMADLLPSVDHIPLRYVKSYDVRPLVTMEERKTY